jgi:hypothetical protein
VRSGAGPRSHCFAIAGFLIAPPIVRHELEQVLADRLQRKVPIERVRINPLAA